MRKKAFLVISVILLLITTTLFAACGEKKDDPNDNGGGTVNPPAAIFTLTLTGDSARSLKVGQTEEVKWTVKKDGVKVSDEPVSVTVTGDAVTYDSATAKASAVQEGTAELTISLTNHADVEAIKVNYTVTNYFFSREVGRGDVGLGNEDSGSVSIFGGQATIAVREAGTDWKLSAKIHIEGYNTTDAFGIGSFADSGDHALWFALKNESGKAGTAYSVYVRDFYKGWGSATADRTEKGYLNKDFGDGAIDFEMVRKGNVYYYNVGGYVGTYETDYAEATYPGFFSQNLPLTLTDYAVTYNPEETAAAVAQYRAGDISALSINETEKFRLVRGTTQKYTAVKMPAFVAETYAWSVDTTKVTTSKGDGEAAADVKPEDTVTVEADGTLKIGANTAGTVTLLCTSASGKVADSLEITILEQSEDAENDLLSVKGGVVLNADGSITFPKIFDGVNGIVDEREYKEADYTAILKQKAVGDFSVEFTVSDYQIKDYEQPCKLMLSIEGTHNQFYVAYSPKIGIRIETFTNTFTSDGKYYGEGGDWAVSDAFADQSAAHTYTITVTKGFYKVLVDGQPVALKVEGKVRESVMLYDYYVKEKSMRMSTQNVACTVSDIKVVNGSAADIPAFYAYNHNTTDISATGFTMKFTDTGWATRDLYANRVIAKDALPENFEMSYTVTFQAGMTDGKFVTRIGNYEFHVCNVLASDSAKLQVQFYNDANGKVSWGDKFDVTANADNPFIVTVKLTRIDGKFTISVNGGDAHEAAGDNAKQLEFYGFNGTAAEKDLTAVMTDLTVKAVVPVEPEA